MNGHDDADPMSFVSELDAVIEAVHRSCRYCRPVVEVMPAAGTRHVLGETHQAGCPHHVPEDTPAAEYDTARLTLIYGIEGLC